MRQIARDVASAWMQGLSKTVKNTSTDGTTVWLFGNPILRRTPEGCVEISLARWPTRTTISRLNDIMQYAGILYRIHTHKGQTILFPVSSESRPVLKDMLMPDEEWVVVAPKEAVVAGIFRRAYE